MRLPAPFSIVHGDCVAVMARFPDSSFDAMVTDPPYELGFMGKSWDASGVTYRRETWEQALRILKPGAHLLAFGGTRTFHRLTCALEDAGFEIRDCLVWLYGSGFPKSRDVSKDIDRIQGEKREVVDASWRGRGTALKPAWEPIILARKPLSGTVAANVLQHGTGALNIDESRIGGAPSPSAARRATSTAPVAPGSYENEAVGRITNRMTVERYREPRAGEQLGRWPANVLLDEEAAALLDEQSGDRSSSRAGGNPNNPKHGQQHTKSSYGWGYESESVDYRDSGGASRFFYCAKASRSERERGLEQLVSEIATRTPMAGRGQGGLKCLACGKWKVSGNPCVCAEPQFEQQTFERRPVANVHPTVKPLALMRYLCKLIAPPDGLILDPFAGSGTTLIAARAEGFSAIGIEKTPEYVTIARHRLESE